LRSERRIEEKVDLAVPYARPSGVHLHRAPSLISHIKIKTSFRQGLTLHDKAEEGEALCDWKSFWDGKRRVKSPRFSLGTD
jgi:hypothetical protein